MKNTDGTNHGEINPSKPKPQAETGPRIPRVFRGRFIVSGLPHEEACRKYGLWKIQITRDCIGPGGVRFKVGDTAKISGDLAVLLVSNGQAVFDDEKFEREDALLKEARELGIAQTPAQLKEFARRP